MTILGISGFIGSGFVVACADAKEVIHPKLSGMTDGYDLVLSPMMI
jgi:hypothetical protein